MLQPMRKRKNEQGIVLLTCLVFLMVLLAMLRFALMSAKVEEDKAGIDLDLMTAHEAAQMGLDQAETEVFRMAKKYCQDKGGTNCTEEKDLISYLSDLFQGEDYRTLAYTQPYSRGSNVAGSYQLAYGKGIYDAQYYSSHGLSSCKPTWICMKWMDSAKAVLDAAQVQRGSTGASANNLEVLPMLVNANDRPPYQFVIERFTADELTGGSGGSSDAVMRITAVGVGRGESGSHLTSKMLQSTYILP